METITEGKENWESNQYQKFDRDWNSKWSKKFPNEDMLRIKILKLPYECFYDVNNAFGKLDKAIQICDFLHNLRKANPPQDTEKIIITILTSCAEAVYRINKPDEQYGENLVKGFFKEVDDKIKYRIRGYIEKTTVETVFSAAEVLYHVRNDYIHNGNFTGPFFRNEKDDEHIYRMGNLYYREKNNNNLVTATSECNLSYPEFTQIYLDAFIKNIIKYIDK